MSRYNRSVTVSWSYHPALASQLESYPSRILELSLSLPSSSSSSSGVKYLMLRYSRARAFLLFAELGAATNPLRDVAIKVQRWERLCNLPLAP